jgi:hypothetical protein
LNGELKGSNKFNLGLDMEHMNKHMKDLFFDSDMGYFDWTELNKFVFKNSDGTSFNYGMTFKEWLSFIYQKIVSYSGQNEIINKVKEDLTKVRELDVDTDNEYFTDQEAKIGELILQSIQKTFGHATIRLILMGMLSINDDVSFRVTSRPNSKELFKIMDHVGFISVKSRSDQHQDSPYTFNSRNYDICFFGAFFLDSHIAFRKGQNDFTKRGDSYILPIGPVILTDQSLSSRNPTHLSYLIAYHWLDMYKSRHGSHRTMDKSKIFLETQEVLADRFEELIIEQVVKDPSIHTDQKATLINRLISEVRGSFFTNSFLKHDQQFYDFLDSGASYGEYAFIGGYKLFISIHDFEGLDIIRWGGGTDSFRSELGNLKRALIDNNINRFISHFKKTITDIGGRIEIFPLYLLGKFGYKGFYGDYQEFLFNCYSIDLRNPDLSSNTKENYRKSENLLKHIGYLMSTLPIAFVVKEAGSTWDTKEIINIFGFRGYMKKFDIYSISAAAGRYFNPEDYFYSAILPDPDDSEAYISFYDDFWDSNNPKGVSSYYSQANDQWNKEIWLNHIGMTRVGSGSELSDYMNMIKRSNSQYAKDIMQILGL